MNTESDTMAATSTYVKEVFEKQQASSIRFRDEKLKNRLVRLKKLHTWVEKNRDAIKHAVNQDFGKPKTEVDISEIYPVISELKHASSKLRDWARPKKVDAPLAYIGSSSEITYEPKGVCLIISPWNYPFNLAISPLISALAAGNTAMLKPSEMTPHTSELIEKMIGELFPDDEVCVFQGGVEVSQELLSLPFDHIFLTGSPAVGKIVMAAAAKHLSSVTLELGGKSPVIVDETANIKDAAEKIAWGKFLNNGQTCLAPDYLMVHSKVREQFIDHLINYTQLLFDKKLEGFDKSPDYARIVNEKHYSRLNELIEDALAHDGKLEMGGTCSPESNFIPPTLISNVAPDARIMQEEIFGPVLPIISYDDLSDTIELINSKPKPLALYYFGRSGKHRNQILKQTSSGAVCVNDCVMHFGQHNLPFGGVNNSGMGRTHGRFGFESFSNIKPVLKQRVGFTPTKTIYPPYTKTVAQLIDKMIKFF